MMKKLSMWSLLLFGSLIFIGCDAAQETIDEAAKAGSDAVEDVKQAGTDAAEKVKDMADIDFGDFDMSGLQDKFSSITDAFKNVTGDNAGDLATKIKDLTGSLGDLGIGDLSGVAKTAVGEAIGKFIEAIQKALEGVSDEGIMSTLKPVVESLVEKLNSFK